jgi:hypothetical protein
LFYYSGLSAFAEVGVAPVFSDHMVMQRDAEIPVRGTATDEKQVTVIFIGFLVLNDKGKYKRARENRRAEQGADSSSGDQESGIDPLRPGKFSQRQPFRGTRYAGLSDSDGYIVRLGLMVTSNGRYQLEQ